jgi:hypothetical protein
MEQQEDENEKGVNEEKEEQQAAKGANEENEQQQEDGKGVNEEQEQQEDEIGDERGDFVVEKVVKEKVLKNGKIRYFVKYEDYSSRW